VQNGQNDSFEMSLNMAPTAANNQTLGSQHLQQLPTNHQIIGSQQLASFPTNGHPNDGSQLLNSSSLGSGSVFVSHQQQYAPIPQLNLQNPIVANNMISMSQMPQISQMSQMPQMPQMSQMQQMQQMPQNLQMMQTPQSHQMPNYYSQSFSQMTGSQTRLDQLANNINYGQNFNNPLSQQQMSFAPNSISGHRFASCEDLQTINNLNDNNQQKSQMESGLHLIQLLREAEKSGFTADDVEVAINFSPNKPLGQIQILISFILHTFVHIQL